MLHVVMFRAIQTEKKELKKFAHPLFSIKSLGS